MEVDTAELRPPDLVEHALGYRTWKLRRDGRLVSCGNGRYSAGRGVWRAGTNTAECVWEDHAAPAGECSCGLYALHEPPQYAAAGFAVGAVRTRDDLHVHADGFRAERAEIVALGYSGRRPRPRERRAAGRYGVPLVRRDRLQAAALEYGRPVPAALRPQPQAEGLPELPDVLLRAREHAQRVYERVASPVRAVPGLRSALIVISRLTPLVTIVWLAALFAAAAGGEFVGSRELALAAAPAVLGGTAMVARRLLGSGLPGPRGGCEGSLLLAALMLPFALPLLNELGASERTLTTAALTGAIMAVVMLLAVGFRGFARGQLAASLGTIAVPVVALALAPRLGDAVTARVLAAAGLVLVVRELGLLRWRRRPWKRFAGRSGQVGPA